MTGVQTCALPIFDSGAAVVAMRAFWISRPNDELRQAEPNRGVALDLARKLGFAAGNGEFAAP